MDWDLKNPIAEGLIRAQTTLQYILHGMDKQYIYRKTTI